MKRQANPSWNDTVTRLTWIAYRSRLRALRRWNAFCNEPNMRKRMRSGKLYVEANKTFIHATNLLHAAI